MNGIVAVHGEPVSTGSATAIILLQQYREVDDCFVVPSYSDLMCNCANSGYSVDTEGSETVTSSLSSPPPFLHTLSLFSGGGLLDNGLEASGFFKTVYGIDHNEMAIRSHQANNAGASPECSYICGSVNLQLKQFLLGNTPLFHIHCLVAGCPCQGFSLLNSHRQTKNSQRNCSLVASTLSWVDLFLPGSVIIENVERMDLTPRDPGLANVYAQAVCCLVAMGYQVRKMVLKACDYGSPTTRTRLFIVASAPSLALPEVPDITHGDSPDLTPIVTVADVLRSMPRIHNDTVINIENPAHIPAHRFKSLIEQGVSLRNVIHRIPKIPGEGLVQAYQRGLLSRNQAHWLTNLSEEQQGFNSKSLRRVNPRTPFRTIVTAISPLDARFGGEIVHPNQDRTLSLEELRRAQGLPPSYILVGKLKQQVEIIGNGVAWQVATAIGKSVGKSWTTHSSKPVTDQVATVVQSLFTRAKTPFTSRKYEIPPKHDTNEAAAIKGKARAITPAPSTPPEFKFHQLLRKQALPSQRESSIDVFEISEFSGHESIVITPNGSREYHRDFRRKVTRQSSSNVTQALPKKLTPVVEIPVRNRTRSVSERPRQSVFNDLEPRTSTVRKPDRGVSTETAFDDSGSDIEFLSSRPMPKRQRMWL
jgi:site-specific DNA-cytosine methylase